MKRSSKILTNAATATGTSEAEVGRVYPPLGGDGPVPSALIITGDVVSTGGTGSAAGTLRIRKGSVAGTQLGPSVAGGSAAQAVSAHLFAKDTAPSGAPYLLTVQQGAGASGAGTVDGFVAVDA